MGTTSSTRVQSQYLGVGNATSVIIIQLERGSTKGPFHEALVGYE